MKKNLLVSCRRICSLCMILPEDRDMKFGIEVDNMRLRNVLIAVNDIDRAIKFYNEIFGLNVILDQDGNVIMSEGLVLQDAKIWQRFLDKELIPKNNMTELYFEESDIESFVKKLEESDFEIEYVNESMTHSWGRTKSSGLRSCADRSGSGDRKVVRFYDPDGNLIEVGTPVN